MKICTLLLLGVIMVLAASSVNGGEWIDLGTDTGGNRYWYDRGALEKLRGGTLTLWIKTVYSNEGRRIKLESMAGEGLNTKDYEKLHDTRALLEIDCTAVERRILRVDHYSNGALIPGGSWSVTLKPSEGWRPIMPGPVGTGLLKAVCGPGRNPGR